MEGHQTMIPMNLGVPGQTGRVILLHVFLCFVKDFDKGFNPIRVLSISAYAVSRTGLQ